MRTAIVYAQSLRESGPIAALVAGSLHATRNVMSDGKFQQIREHEIADRRRTSIYFVALMIAVLIIIVAFATAVR